MKKALVFVAKAVLAGLLVVVPIYLAVLVLLKGMKSVAAAGAANRPAPPRLVSSRAGYVPSSRAYDLLSDRRCRPHSGRTSRSASGPRKLFFERIPGYALFRSLTQRLAGEDQESTWKPALVEIEDALVPAFIIEEFEDGRYTVFVPSIPTPLAGAVYILDRKRVHPLDVPFTEALKAVSRWGSGAKDLVAVMERGGNLSR